MPKTAAERNAEIIRQQQEGTYRGYIDFNWPDFTYMTIDGPRNLDFQNARISFSEVSAYVSPIDLSYQYDET